MTRTTRSSSRAPRSSIGFAFLALLPAFLVACGADGRMGFVGGDPGDSGAFPPPALVADGGPSTPPSPSGECKDGTEGCPCTTSGDIAACGVVHFTSGVYKGCDPGASRCMEDLTWGPCAATGLPMPATAVDNTR